MVDVRRNAGKSASRASSARSPAPSRRASAAAMSGRRANSSVGLPSVVISSSIGKSPVASISAAGYRPRRASNCLAAFAVVCSCPAINASEVSNCVRAVRTSSAVDSPLAKRRSVSSTIRRRASLVRLATCSCCKDELRFIQAIAV